MNNNIELSGDASIKIQAGSLDRLFIKAAEEMYCLITDTSSISCTETRQVDLSASDIEEAMIVWLNELIFLFDTYGFTGRHFHVTINGLQISARIEGGIFDPLIHEQKLLVKAATYHRLSVSKTETGYKARIVFDL